MIVNHASNVNPGKPDSVIVGVSGHCGCRVGVETASSFIFLPWTSEVTVARPRKATCTSPLATPSAACDAPLYGTCVIRISARSSNSAIATCCGLPMPPDP